MGRAKGEAHTFEKKHVWRRGGPWQPLGQANGEAHNIQEMGRAKGAAHTFEPKSILAPGRALATVQAGQRWSGLSVLGFRPPYGFGFTPL